MCNPIVPKPPNDVKWFMACSSCAERYEVLGYSVHWMRSGDNDAGECWSCESVARLYRVVDERKRSQNDE